MHTYHPIDLSQWERSEIYNHFSRMRLPHYAVAANIDVTALLDYKRKHGLSFYLSLIYLATKAINSIENFHLRNKDGQVVSYDCIHTNFTHKSPEEEIFHFYTAAFEGTMEEYVRQTSKELPLQDSLFGGLGDIPNVVYYSCVPTMETTMISNPGLERPEDAIPRINWGKYVERDGRWKLNLSVTVNHRFIDGYHIGLFVQRLQELIDALDA